MDGAFVKYVHILYAEGTAPPLHAFESSSAAYATASAQLGVDVVTLPVLTQVPDVIRDDLETDFDDRDDTPPLGVDVASLDDID